MKENTLHYNYETTVREIYDLTKEEAIEFAAKGKILYNGL